MMTDWPTRLLTQNGELRQIGVSNWSIPAHIVRLPDGSLFNTCPDAGVCARVCYAKMNAYRFRNVLARHTRNLMLVLDHTDEWQERMTAELGARRFRPTGIAHDLEHDPADEWLAGWVDAGGKAVRVHDAGDFFARWYLERWTQIARATPDVLVYAYTKSVTMVRNAELPENMRIIYSLGGLEDHLVNKDSDRHAEVFPTAERLLSAGYVDQEDSDLLAVLHPSHRIGIVANRIPAANAKFAGRTMSEMAVRIRP